MNKKLEKHIEELVEENKQTSIYVDSNVDEELYSRIIDCVDNNWMVELHEIIDENNLEWYEDDSCIHDPYLVNKEEALYLWTKRFDCLTSVPVMIDIRDGRELKWYFVGDTYELK